MKKIRKTVKQKLKELEIRNNLTVIYLERIFPEYKFDIHTDYFMKNYFTTLGVLHSTKGTHLGVKYTLPEDLNLKEIVYYAEEGIRKINCTLQLELHILGRN